MQNLCSEAEVRLCGGQDLVFLNELVADRELYMLD